jgi:hypothetical protein
MATSSWQLTSSDVAPTVAGLDTMSDEDEEEQKENEEENEEVVLDGNHCQWKFEADIVCDCGDEYWSD